MLSRLFNSVSRHNLLQRTFSNVKLISLNLIDSNNESYTVKAKEGDSIFEVCVENDVPMEAACRGECCCSTCHIIVEDDLYYKLPTAKQEEKEMLEFAMGKTKTSRLGCQVRVSSDFEGSTIKIPPIY